MENGLRQRFLNGSEEEKPEENLKVKVYDESKKIWRVALPGILSRVASFGSIVVTQSFVGHISELDLAAYALVQTLTVRFVNGILIGMSSATETLCGQAYGAGQYHMMGVYLQRSWIVDFITLTVLLPFFIFATPIFRLLGEESSIATSAGYVSYWFIPFIYNFVFSLTIQMFLQAQQKNRIIAWLSVMQFIIHIPLSWLLVYKLDYGVPGAMIALSISSWLVVIGEFIYILGGWCPETWKGFSMAAFKDIFPVVKLSISSGIMVCLGLDYDNNQLLFKIQQLSCQVGSEWSGDVGLYVMTINLLRMLSTYEWEAKAVMLLAAFSKNHGDQCIFTHQSRRLAKKVWLLKQSTAPHPNDTTTFDDDDRQRTIVGSINSILNLTKRMLELKQLPPEFIPLSLDTDILSSTVYHITQAVLVCASLLKSLGVPRSQIPAGVVESLAHYKKEFEDTDITLQALLNDCHNKIEEKEVQESYEALKLAFSRSDLSDNRDILKLLFNVKDDQNMPLYHGETKAEAELDVIPTDKNVLLVISSGLDISKERAEYLGKVYKDCQQNHGMIWIPVVNGRREFWSAEKVNEFESLRGVMGFYSVKDPRKAVAAGLHKYVEEDLFQAGEKDDFFRIGKEPIVVVLDYKGKFVHKNAMGMILAWGADASPFDTYKEECMWRDETWGTALMAATIHPIRQWMNAKPQGADKECLFFLYGGNAIEWVQQFKIEVEKSLSSDYEPRMMYVGRNKEVRSSIASSDCLDEPSTWLFYTRLQSTLLSRMHYLSKFGLNKVGHDNILRLFKKLVAYKSLGETGGWCLLCTKDDVIRCTNEATMLTLLTEYKNNGKELIAKDNDNHFDDVVIRLNPSNSFSSLYHQPCCELEYPSELEYPTTFTEIPESEMCPVCYTYMYKLITFACCHGHDDYDLE